MTKNEKIGVGVADIGAFALGWWLHKNKTSAGVNILVHFTPNAGVQYKVADANTVLHDWDYNAADLTLVESEYWVAISAGG